MAYERFIPAWYFSEAYTTNRILCTLHRGTIIFTLWQPLLLLEEQLYRLLEIESWANPAFVKVKGIETGPVWIKTKINPIILEEMGRTTL